MKVYATDFWQDGLDFLADLLEASYEETVEVPRKSTVGKPIDLKLVRNEDDYQVHAALPGVDIKDIEFEYKKVDTTNRVTLTLKEDSLYASKGSRSVLIPNDADIEKTIASFKNGLFTATVPKIAKEKRSGKVTVEFL
jgi:HSP20 family molecular chaperone IbpA